MKDINAMKNSSVEILDLSVRSSNYLKNLNIYTIGELTCKKDLENPHVRDCWSGHKAEKGIIVPLSMLGLHLNMNDEAWEKWAITEVTLPLPEDYYRMFFYNVSFHSFQDIFIFVEDYLNKKGLVQTCYTDITEYFNSETTTKYSSFTDINQGISFYNENYEDIAHIMFLIEEDENTLLDSKKRIEEIFDKNNLEVKSLHVSIVPTNINPRVRMIYQKVYS